MSGGFGLSVNVHVVSGPDCTVMVLTVSPLRVPVGVPSSSVQTALSSAQLAGMVSLTEAVVPNGMPKVGVSPLPVIWNGLAPGLAVKEKTWVVPAGATLTHFMKPANALTMQSNGLLFPPLPADGYEHTLISSAPAGRKLLAMLTAMVESFGKF